MQHFVHEWRDQGCSPWVLKVLAEGYKISFLEQPPLRRAADQFWEPIARETGDQRPVGSRSSGERGLRDSSDHLFPGFLQPSFYSPEGVGPMETHHRSFNAQHVREHPHLPDGYPGSHQTVFNTRQLGSIARSTRCLSAIANPHESPASIFVFRATRPCTNFGHFRSACQLPLGFSQRLWTK